MNKKAKCAAAQVISLPKFSGDVNAKEDVNMKSKKISLDGYRKINRAKNVSFSMHLLIRRQEVNAAPLLWIPDIFSYIADDISDISEELKAQGLYDQWLQQERDELDKE